MSVTLDIKTKILIKKITVNFIIDSYAGVDRMYRYVHMGIAVTTPLISLLDYAVTGNVNATFSTSLVLSAVVAGMVKIKEHMKFDKIRDIAKHQSLRYERLYKHIEAEEIKHAADPEFLYWINRAFNDIEQLDPELPARDREKVNLFLSQHKITVQTDIQRLHTSHPQAAMVPAVYDTSDDIRINIDRLAALNI